MEYTIRDAARIGPRRPRRKRQAAGPGISGERPAKAQPAGRRPGRQRRTASQGARAMSTPPRRELDFENMDKHNEHAAKARARVYKTMSTPPRREHDIEKVGKRHEHAA